MSERRGSRFALEVLFLIALAIGLALTRLDPLEIVGVMAVGWLIMAAIEWASWRSEPHYGSGLPPRYYIPQVSLPPAQPLEQVSSGYPEAQRDEAPTWIASAALREEMLGEWPSAVPPLIPETEPVAVEEDEEPEPVFVPAAEAEDPWQIAELPAEPLPLPEPEPEPEAEAEPDPNLDLVPDQVEEPEPEHEPEPVPEPEPEPQLDVELTRSVQGVARYSLDPLAEAPVKRRFGRGGGGEPVPAVEVPSRPDGVRALPGRSSRQD